MLQRQGVDIGREQTARLMRSAGLSGKGKGGAPITTREPKGPDLRPDLVNREFRAPWPSSSVGDGHYLRAHQERLCVHRVRDRCILPEDRRMGAVRLDAHRSFAAAGARPGDRVCQGNNGLDSPFRPRLTRWIQLVVATP